MTDQSRASGMGLILLLGALAGLTPLAIDMYLPAIPTIADEMGASVATTQLTVSFFLVGFAVGQLLYGSLTDAYGRMPVLGASLGVFILASVAATWSRSVEMLIAARTLQALGGAGASVVVMAVLRDLFQKERFARAMSFVMLVMNLAPLAAPILGGFLLIQGGWRAIFVLLALFALALVVMMRWRVGETLPTEQRRPAGVKAALALYRSILAHGTVRAHLIVGTLFSASLFLFITGSSYVYIRYFGVAAEHFGFLFGLNILTMMALTTLNARFVARVGTARMMLRGLLTTALGALLALVTSLLGDPPLWAVVIPIMLMMGPLGMVSANATTLALDAFDGAAGSVSALGGAMRFLAGAVAGGLLSLVHPQSPAPMLTGMAVCSLASLGYHLWHEKHLTVKEQP
ncbi:Bcr/CflA family multidrug efflux MFS transporter [Ferrimonas sediminicola]|uniref:Bcr/CflA family efflux transporter n=1 Tax=Ferrimonas sediminicola TaxID=2569538 RepID=A0A4U1BE94_9GAMM|nr:Bcr/CflA family multidrug efflux MFS transporter [Ferrimonas sediminicola]TKB49372.1 Bcr/CflA family multidrug efflux MFS transporter [Ferrimonas sediminicola]